MNRAEKIEESAAMWIAREDSTGLVDRAALDVWLEQDTAHRIAYLRLKDAWQRANSLAALRVVLPPRKRWLPRFDNLWMRSLAAAAIIMIGGGIGLFLYLRANDKVYATAVGKQKDIQLADGSRIELNTNTRVRTAVEGNIRAVTLEKGQAYFEVVHDSKHPFVVIAGNRRITDLGTKFSVKRNGDSVEVVVQEGKVRVDVLSTAQEHLPIFADAGEVVVAKADETLVAARGPREITDALGWRFGVLVFNQETLADVAAEFNRYNNRKIIVRGDARTIRVGGSFRADNVDVFAQLAKEGFGLNVNDNEREIIISK